MPTLQDALLGAMDAHVTLGQLACKPGYKLVALAEVWNSNVGMWVPEVVPGGVPMDLSQHNPSMFVNEHRRIVVELKPI